jgi:tRNA nucleotidyltransferase (CCA-adding enzyme)
MFILPTYVDTVLDTLTESGYEAYIVGGCVRDFLLGRTPSDFDVTTSATPAQTIEAFKGFQVIETGLKHGTVTVLVDSHQVEVTTYRVDGAYSDGRHPDSVEYTSSLKDDLSRRDFTINAMAYNRTEGIVDEFNGVMDLNNRVIRCVGDPKLRFSEDALRILRAIRFSSQLSFSIDKDTSYVVHSYRDSLQRVSKERINAELNKLLLGDNVYSVLMEYSDVMATIIPEVSDCIGFNQRSRYHKYSVWEHMAVSVANAPEYLDVRLAMLLHDVAKPATFTLDEEGHGHFTHHAYVGADTVRKVLRDLKYDNETVRRVTALVYHHDDDFYTEYEVKKCMNEVGFETFLELMAVQTADSESKQDFCRSRIAHIDSVRRFAIDVVMCGDCISLKQLAVRGGDLKRLGYEGKQIGDTLELLLDEVMRGNLHNEAPELLEYAERLKG